MNYVGEKPSDPITFNIYPDEKGSASATLYEDDGVSPAYKQDGFRRTNVSARRIGAVYDVTIAAPTGKYQPTPRKLVFILKSAARIGRPVTVADGGSARTIKIN